MKKIVTLSLVAAMSTTMAFGSTASDLRAMKAEIAKLKAEVSTLKKGGDAAKIKKLTKKINTVKAHDAGDNIKWGVDLRTSIDSIEYTMANGQKRSKNDLMATRLWLNMAYAPDSHNIFKGQLSYNKAFGADFNFGRGWGMDNFDWITNEALTGNSLKVRQAYWLYLGDTLFGADIPWTFSIGRRPSTTGFLSNLRENDAAQSPLGHIIDVEFDGLSSKIDLSNVTGIPGMSFKICMGQGSTNASARYTTPTDYVNIDGTVDDIKLAGFIFEPYNDGQFIVKTTAFRAFGLPGMNNPMDPSAGFKNVGDMDGAALSVMVDGLAEDGFLADAKVFGSFAWSKTRPDAGEYMLQNPMINPVSESHTGTSYWLGAQVPLFGGKLGAEFNHGSKYWRSFTYAEDTMIGSKLAARGDAWELYYTYQLTDALSAQFRYTSIDYDYSGSNQFFGMGGTPLKVEQVKAGLFGPAMQGMVVDKAQDARFYLRYRF
jgi:hypothetical protein